MPEIRVGISGWTYAPWRGNFYPDGLTQKLELPYASRRFSALEINGTFYSLQRPKSFQAWYDATPPGFVFTMKGGKYLTHVSRLKDPLVPLANFLASGVLCLREKLGPILWQFPPTMSFNEDRFKHFFELLPHTTKELVALAKKHDSFVEGKTHLEADADRPVRHAVEFRHESFLNERFIDLARAHNIAVVVADAASKFPSIEDVTADWMYIRLHGEREGRESGYTSAEIRDWAKKIRTYHAGGEPSDARRIGPKAATAKNGRDIFVLFDNTDVKERSPVDARAMAEELGVGPAEPEAQILDELSVRPKASKQPAATSSAKKKATKKKSTRRRNA